MNNSSLKEIIINRLTQSFNPITLELIDESHKHKNHINFKEDKFHFKLIISSKKFNKISLIQAHKEIYLCLQDLFENKIHAFSILIKIG